MLHSKDKPSPKCFKFVVLPEPEGPMMAPMLHLKLKASHFNMKTFCVIVPWKVKSNAFETSYVNLSRDTSTEYSFATAASLIFLPRQGCKSMVSKESSGPRHPPPLPLAKNSTWESMDT